MTPEFGDEAGDAHGCRHVNPVCTTSLADLTELPEWSRPLSALARRLLYLGHAECAQVMRCRSRWRRSPPRSTSARSVLQVRARHADPGRRVHLPRARRGASASRSTSTSRSVTARRSRLEQLARFGIVAVATALLMAVAMKIVRRQASRAVPVLAKLICAAVVFVAWTYPAQRRLCSVPSLQGARS